MEAVEDAPAGGLEHHVLASDRPLAGERPVVEPQPLARLGLMLAARVAEVRLGRAEVLPVGLRLGPDSHDVDELALDAEQLLDRSLRLLVAAFTEVVVADDAFAVDEVERRPVMVVERAPDLVLV